MKFLERFLINIFSNPTISLLLPGARGNRLRQMREAGMLARVLRSGVDILDDKTQSDVRAWVVSQQTGLGGFPDRSGKCDLYYTLFGFFLTESLEIKVVLPMLKNYVKITAQQKDHTGIDLFCFAILHASLFPDDPGTNRFVQKIRKLGDDKAMLQNGYSRFLVMLSLLYLRDHAGAWRVLKSVGKQNQGTVKPCPIVAAEHILAFMKSGSNGLDPDLLMSFYRGNGGFAALPDAPVPDLLSTAVSLFALQLSGYDLRLIRPDCLNFVDGLYNDGGFSANMQDNEVDVEYTFYGLLALGALN